MDLLSLLDTAARLVLSLSIVTTVIALGWLTAYKLLLEQLPLVRDLLGKGDKVPRPRGTRRVVSVAANVSE